MRILSLFLATCAVVPAWAQLNVNATMTPQELVQNVLVGGGVSISNVTFNGAVVSTPQDGSGSFTNGNSTNLGLDAGLILSTGLVTTIPGPASDFGSDPLGTGSDPDLLAITSPGNSIQDISILEFDFVPTGDSLKFNYVFGSEEYPTFNCSASFNDVFGFFLSGPGISGPYTNNAANIALVPGSTLPVSIANIHGPGGTCGPANEQFYVDNSGGTTISLNGFTTLLRAEASVICGETYHIKLAIGDAGDGSYNSAVFLQAGSFQSNVLPSLTASTMMGAGTAVEGCLGGSFVVHRPSGADSTYSIDFFFTGTATPGVDFTDIPSPAVIPAGQDSVVLHFDVFQDGVEEPVESAVMNVFLVNACGDTITNSAWVALLDYPEMEIHSPTSLLLQCDQDSIPLFASITGGVGQVTMTWNDSIHADHIYVSGMANGSYTVTATDECPSSASLAIEVDAGCKVIIPNVITPNGDGQNDRFVVEGILGRDNQVRIWDRWGKEVLNATNYQNTFSAKGLHDGVYFYSVRVLEQEFTGHLQILGSK